MPRRKKDPSTRARRNKTSTRATLTKVLPDASAAESFESMTVAQLRAAVDAANESRPTDQQIDRGGRKAELVAALVAAQSSVPTLPAHPPRYFETADGERIEFEVEWHEQTRSWWIDVWTSPMASEWDESDVHNVAALALVYDDIWSASTAKDRKDALAEYRLQRADLGLSPYARRRLEWTIETAAEAKDRGEKRRSNGRQPQPAAKQGGTRPDPRAALHVVS